jgi:hypothetical protein
MTAKKKDEPAEVEQLGVVVGDAKALMTVNDVVFALRPDQVHTLRRLLDRAFVDLH